MPTYHAPAASAAGPDTPVDPTAERPRLLMTAEEFLAYTSEHVRHRLAELRVEVEAVDSAAGRGRFGDRFRAAFRSGRTTDVDPMNPTAAPGTELTRRLARVGAGHENDSRHPDESVDWPAWGFPA